MPGRRPSSGFLEFFAAAIANDRTRAAYGRAAGRFLAWCASRGLRLRAIAPLHVVAPPDLPAERVDLLAQLMPPCPEFFVVLRAGALRVDLRP